MAYLRWLTLASFLLWFVLYWEGGRRALSDIRHATSPLDGALMIAIAIAGGALIAVVGGMAVGVLSPAWESYPVSIIGLLLTWAGIGGTFYSRHYLGRFWTAEAALQEEHRVVDSGPYAIVRHPIYTAAIALYIGLGLSFPAWWTGAAVAVIVISYAWKARLEDDFLDAELPGYREYRRRTRYRLVPGVW